MDTKIEGLIIWKIWIGVHGQRTLDLISQFASVRPHKAHSPVQPSLPSPPTGATMDHCKCFNFNFIAANARVVAICSSPSSVSIGRHCVSPVGGLLNWCG
eukprot:scaffold304_cov216-Alexandrium_tamarense.AAC.1